MVKGEGVVLLVNRKTLYTGLLPLQDNSKSNIVRFDGGKIAYVYGVEVMVDDNVADSTVLAGDLSKVIGAMARTSTYMRISTSTPTATSSWCFHVRRGCRHRKCVCQAGSRCGLIGGDLNAGKGQTGAAYHTTAFDSEISDLIDAALADLGLAGVAEKSETDPLIIRAVTTYCRPTLASRTTTSDEDCLRRAEGPAAVCHRLHRLGGCLMDRSRVLTLIGQTYKADALASRCPWKRAERYSAMSPGVSATEFFEAGRAGICPEYRVTLFAFDYNGESIAELEGVRYGVYRTYLKSGEDIELYLERKAGV